MKQQVKVLVPVRYSAWLQGELGQAIFELVQDGSNAEVTMMPRGLLVQASDVSHGALTDRLIGVVQDIERTVAQRYPVFHSEMGPVWTGTLQAIFPARERAGSPTGAKTSRQHAAPPEPNKAAVG